MNWPFLDVEAMLADSPKKKELCVNIAYIVQQLI